MAFTVSSDDRYFADEYVPSSFLVKEAWCGLSILCIKARNAIKLHQLNTKLDNKLRDLTK